MTRVEDKEIEIRNLAKVYSTHPDLFKLHTFVEDAELLEPLGIRIPYKDVLPQGFLKFTPSDFIVEEVDEKGEVCTIERRNLASEADLPEAQSYFATLVKCGIQTEEAIRDLAELLDCPKENIRYAGIKDKDAITAQRISIKGVSPEKIRSASSAHFFLKDVTAGVGVMDRGKLTGNRFTIFMRLPAPLEKTEKKDIFMQAVERVTHGEVYNFYYLQRFGTPRLSNFRWAYSIIKGDYGKAVKQYLTESSPNELPYVQFLRNEVLARWGSWRECIEYFEPFPVLFDCELRILRHLLNHEGDYVGALQQIPEQIMLWVYAVSSWLFNEKLSIYAQVGGPLPKELPLFLSFDRKDLEPYRNILEDNHMYPPPFRNLKPFPAIRLMHRTVDTKVDAKMHSVKITNEGVALSFTLDKGQYATTFLAHLFVLLSGKPPEEIPDIVVDTKSLLGEGSSESAIEFFKEVLHTKRDNIFEKLIGEEN